MIKPEYKEDLAVLLLTELLAYQFASPVRWIETQDVIINDFKAEKIIEIGPSPILANMATRTIKANESHEMAMGTLPKRQVYCTANNLDKIYYGFDIPAHSPAVGSLSKNFTNPTTKEICVAEYAAPITNFIPDSSLPTNITNIESQKFSADIKLTSRHILTALVTNKLPSCTYLDINLDKSLKELSQGKSTLQNEIKSDLIKEFESFKDDNVEDISLSELSSLLETEKLGVVTLPQVIKFVSKHFCGKFNTLINVRNYLIREWSMRDPNPILLFMAYKDSSFKTRFATEDETKNFIDKCCYLFAAKENITIIATKTNSQKLKGQTEGDDDEKSRVISLEEYNKFKDDLRVLNTQQNEVLNKHLSVSKDGDKVNVMVEELEIMKQKFALLEEEFGGYFINESINQMFSAAKVRIYDSSWNWSRQDALLLFYSNSNHHGSISKKEVQKNVRNMLNRVDAISLKILQYQVENNCRDESWKQFLMEVLRKCQESVNMQPVYTNNADISVHISGLEEVVEELPDDCFTSQQYIKRISLGNNTQFVDTDSSLVSTKLDKDLSSYYKIETELFQVYSKIIQYALAASNSNPGDLWGQFESLYEQLLIFLKNSDQIASCFRGIVSDALSSINRPLYSKNDEVMVHDYIVDSSSDDDDEYDPDTDDVPFKLNKIKCEDDRSTLEEEKQLKEHDSCTIPVGVIPFLHIKRHSNTNDEWIYDKTYTQLYLNNLLAIGSTGLSLSGKTALLLVSKIDGDWIVREITKALLEAGATVLVATNEFNHDITKSFQDIYHQYGSKGSQLVVLPLNQGSKVDIKRLCDYVYTRFHDIDYLLPLNIHDSDTEMTDVSAEDELKLRSTSLNFLRLLGNIVEAKKMREIETRPTFILLPLSPICGTKSSNELLSESYAYLNKMLSRWHVEGWKEQLSICGCIYGWTSSNKNEDIPMKGLEKLGIRIFSPDEMAFNVVGLLTYDIVSLAQDAPIVADLNGGLHTLPSIMPVMAALQSELNEDIFVQKELAEETRRDNSMLSCNLEDTGCEVDPKGNINLKFPMLPSYDTLQNEFNGSDIEGLVDPTHTVVITGFSEVGPWGNARTRWEMESTGVFSLEGCIEMAWIMGLIKYKQTSNYCGWTDANTGEPLEGLQVKEKYESSILKHSGIRIIEPELFCGYNPSKKQMLQEVIINHDLQPIQTSAALAAQYKSEQGDKVDVFPIENNECMVKFLKGASLYVPKALDIERMVAGQVPTGWSAESYGIPEDITTQVDPITLFALVSTAEALISSGITDPYEMYKYVHVSEVGNCIGSGIGGMRSHEAMQVQRTKGDSIQSDILQETFLNVVAAWINMLLISSSGPIKTPVGACATAVESVEMGYETIMSGKAKVCIVGGVDDFHGTISHEFANMGATSNSVEETNNGREPKEMCRPATSTRNGFMESQGAGVQVIMRGDLAVEMGVPIYGIVGMTATASDKISKSLPAPGKGVLTCAKECKPRAKFASSKLNIAYRKRQLDFRKEEISQWAREELTMGGDSNLIEDLVERQLIEARMHWGTKYWNNDPNIAPIRGALSVFGLSIDDLNVASCHGTSTKANEKNESQILNKMMDHLGRTVGNPLITVFQKHLTGHPKGAAGAWMLNGCLQIMNSGIIPGNRNADNIDNAFEMFEHLVYPSRSIDVKTVKACCVTSFGFGQKGAMALVINPNFLLACLSEKNFETYSRKMKQREKSCNSYYVNGIVRNQIVQVKNNPPYAKEVEESVYLDPLARYDHK